MIVSTDYENYVWFLGRGAPEAAREWCDHHKDTAVEAVITYTDRVHRGGVWHEYRCRQHVRVNGAELIEEIRHEELPGERQRLRGLPVSPDCVPRSRARKTRARPWRLAATAGYWHRKVRTRS